MQSIVKCGMQLGQGIPVLGIHFASTVDDNVMSAVFGMGQQVFEH